MKKVKIFSCFDEQTLEKNINEFIEGHDVADIQFSTAAGNRSPKLTDLRLSTMYSALIEYRVQEWKE